MLFAQLWAIIPPNAMLMLCLLQDYYALPTRYPAGYATPSTAFMAVRYALMCHKSGTLGLRNFPEGHPTAHTPVIALRWTAVTV